MATDHSVKLENSAFLPADDLFQWLESDSKKNFKKFEDRIKKSKQEDINEVSGGKTLLHLACEKLKPKHIELLMKYGADCNVVDHVGETPAFKLAKELHKERNSHRETEANNKIKNIKYCLELLIKSGAKIKVTDTFDTSTNGELLNKLFEDIRKNQLTIKEEVSEVIKECNKMGTTALHEAVEANNSEILESIIEVGLDVNKKDLKGRTPLWIAAKKNHVDCLKVLLEKNANVNDKNLKNISVLQVAAMKNHVDCIKLLLEKNVDLASVNYNDECVMNSMFENVPNYDELLSGAFYRRMKFVEKNRKKIKCDFNLLLEKHNHNNEDDTDFQMARVSKIFDICKRKEFIEICFHPYFKLFLAEKKSRQIYNILLILEITYALFYWFVILFYFISLREANKKSKLEITNHVLIIIIVVIRLLLGILKIVTIPYKWPKSFSKFMEYIKPYPYKTFFLMHCVNPLILAFIALVDFLSPNSFAGFHNYIIYFVCITFLLVSIEPFLLFGRLWNLEHYIEIFFKVFLRVIQVFCLFIWILFAFAISFHILFIHYEEFSGIFSSFTKTVVMMTGEFDYEDIFKINTTDLNLKERFESPLPKVIFMLFINVVFIVVGNLIIGMNIDDIRTLQKKHEIRSLRKQVQRLAQIEFFFKMCKNYFEMFLNNFFGNLLKKCSVPQECIFSKELIRKISPDLLTNKNIKIEIEKNI